VNILSAGRHRKYDGDVLAAFAKIIERSAFRGSNGQGSTGGFA